MVLQKRMKLYTARKYKSCMDLVPGERNNREASEKEWFRNTVGHKCRSLGDGEDTASQDHGSSKSSAASEAYAWSWLEGWAHIHGWGPGKG